MKKNIIIGLSIIIGCVSINSYATTYTCPTVKELEQCNGSCPTNVPGLGTLNGYPASQNSGWVFEMMKLVNPSLYYPAGDMQCLYRSSDWSSYYTYISNYSNPPPTVTKQSGPWVDGGDSWGTYSMCDDANPKNCVIDVKVDTKL